MEIHMWQKKNDCDYGSMVNGVSSMDVTFILQIIYVCYSSFLTVGLESYLQSSVDHTIALKVIDCSRYSTTEYKVGAEHR